MEDCSMDYSADATDEDNYDYHIFISRKLEADNIHFWVYGYLEITPPGKSVGRTVKFKEYDHIDSKALANSYIKMIQTEYLEISNKCMSGELNPQVLYDEAP
jgi:hypothetical protein